jgi:peptidoglycan/xylan/chitin deacetylase (PgdA/CDA1 family)
MTASDLLRFAMRRPAASRILDLLEEAESRRPDLLRILAYHRIAGAPEFDRQMAHLAARYNVIGAETLLERLASGGQLPPRSVMITFDDADRDLAEIAWPVLRRRGLPAAAFVATAFPDRSERVFWWERIEGALRTTPLRGRVGTPLGPVSLATAAARRESLRRVKRTLKDLPNERVEREARRFAEALRAPPGESRVLGWDELRRLAGEGLRIGAHSRTHPFMNRITAGRARLEACGSRDDLRRELPGALPIFAYPDGRYGPEAIGALREAGFVCAFTMRRGTNDLRRADPLRLRRINVAPHATLEVVRARLIHSSSYLNRWRPLFDPQRSLAGA